MGIFDNFNMNFSFGANNWFAPTFYVPQFTFPSFTNLWSNFKISFDNWSIPPLNYSIFSWNPQVYGSNNSYMAPSLFYPIQTNIPPSYTNYASVTPSTFNTGGSFFDLSLPKIEIPQNTTPSVKLTEVKTEAKSDNKTVNKPQKTSAKKSNPNSAYMNLSKAEAEKKAKTDSKLEKLTGGKNWSVANTPSDNSFITDIPYAKKGTGKILDAVAAQVGEKLVITSALGTGQAGNPHQKSGYESHHNADNPKLDIRTHGNGRKLAKKLRDTGYFSRVSVERDHLDVQIDPKKYEELDLLG